MIRPQRWHHNFMAFKSVDVAFSFRIVRFLHLSYSRGLHHLEVLLRVVAYFVKRNLNIVVNVRKLGILKVKIHIVANVV